MDARNASKEGVGDSTLITFTISDSVISIICFSKEDATLLFSYVLERVASITVQKYKKIRDVTSTITDLS